MTGWRWTVFGFATLLVAAFFVSPRHVVAEATGGGTDARLLDGRVFVGETGRDGRDRGTSDKFVFQDGKFRAAGFAAYGFGEAEYDSEPIEGGFRFEVQVTSKRSAGGAMTWSGTLTGDTLEGTMRWDHGWESRQYWFRGRAKPAAVASR